MILKTDTNTQTQYNLSLHFLFDHDKFNEVIEEIIVAIDKLDYPHYHYDNNPSKIKRSN